MTDPNDSMCKENRKGPRMEPCGTPQESEAHDEKASAAITEKLLFVTYDLN